MTREELLRNLANLVEEGFDTETARIYADQILLDFINDKEIEDAFKRIPKWYT